MDRAKHPELAKEYDELAAAKAKILADLAPDEAEAAKLRAVADAAEEAWKKKRTAIAAVENQRELRKISGRLAALARAMGAISLKAAGR
jgi:hypothetical protein